MSVQVPAHCPLQLTISCLVRKQTGSLVLPTEFVFKESGGSLYIWGEPEAGTVIMVRYSLVTQSST